MNISPNETHDHPKAVTDEDKQRLEQLAASARRKTAAAVSKQRKLIANLNSDLEKHGDPERWKKGPYVPGPGGSPAALAGTPIAEGEGLAIELPRGVGLTPAGGSDRPVIAPAPAPATPLGSDAAFVARRDQMILIKFFY